MIRDPRFPVEPWHVRELGLDLTKLAQSESIFALSNGHIGLRGNLDEGEPAGLPGSYLNSFYESRPLPYGESGYGYPESGQTIVNVTNGKLIRLLVDDEPFDVRYGSLVHHERILELRTGLLRRVLEWESPSGHRVRVRSTRLVSFTQRAIVAIHYEVEAVGTPSRIVVQSELVANEEVPHVAGDPRVAAVVEHPLAAEEHSATDDRTLLIHRTRGTGLRLAVAAGHVLQTPTANARSYAEEDWSRTTVGIALEAGERLAFTKFVAYGWSSQRTLPAIRDQVDAALAAAVYTGWDDLVAEQRDYVEEFWDGADVALDGDPAVQQAVRFGLFHVLQAGARAERRPIPAKGLTGPGYDGHAFWDTEMYVLPVLTATAPHAAGDALRWRLRTMNLALNRASTLTLRGAAFPWRTIDGEECSAYWPAGTAAFHINADIAVAAARHVHWTADTDFDRECALPLLVNTARLWLSLGCTGDDGRFHINGVTGPDEYSALGDDNCYTNLMAARNLTEAAASARRWPADAASLEVDEAELQSWELAAERMALPYDDNRQIYQQDRGYTEHQLWDFDRTARQAGYPLLLHAPYFDLYRRQVVKQADMVLALHWCGDQFTALERARTFAYYEALTVRDSSLSACTQSVVAADVGHLDLAYDYLCEAALMDLEDLEHNTRDGVHIASLAGTWLALVCGFGGMRDYGGQLSFAPRLATPLTELRFAVRRRDATLRVFVTGESATYLLDDGATSQITFSHYGESLTLGTGKRVTLPIPAVTPLTDPPSQPASRAPARATSERN